MTSALTDQYRRHTLTLRAATVRDLLAVWPLLDYANLDATFPTWYAAAGQIVVRDRKLAAMLAAVYVAQARKAAGVPGVFGPIAAQPLPAEQLATALYVTGVVNAKHATAAGTDSATVMKNAFVTSSGAGSRLALNGGRETIMATTVADPASGGWRRVASGSACAFCRMLAGRGAVYTELSVQFRCHDHCTCSAEPVFGGSRAVRRTSYTPSTRFRTQQQRDLHNARTREGMRRL